MKTAKYCAIEDMKSSGISTSILSQEKEIKTLATLKIILLTLEEYEQLDVLNSL